MRTKYIFLWGAIVASVVVAIVFLWLYTPSYLESKFPGDLAKQGQFGDMFGMVNALFSGLALSGAILAIILQSIELNQQRKELEESNKFFKAQNEILDKQFKATVAVQKAAEEKERLASLPFLGFRAPSVMEDVLAVEARNLGARIFYVNIKTKGMEYLGNLPIDIWPTDHICALNFRAPQGHNVRDLDFSFTLEFTTTLGKQESITYEVKGRDRIPRRV